MLKTNKRKLPKKIIQNIFDIGKYEENLEDIVQKNIEKRNFRKVGKYIGIFDVLDFSINSEFNQDI